MAKAEKKFVCSECGKEFVVSRKFFKRADADAWLEWADNDYYNRCPKCYGEYMHALEAAKKMSVTYSIVNKDYVIMEKAVFSDTVGKEEALMDFGAKKYLGVWEYYFPLINYERNTEEEKRLEQTLGVEDVRFNQNFKYLLEKVLENKDVFEEKRKKKLEIDSLAMQETVKRLGDKPEYPKVFKDIIAKGKWNRKIYGSKGNKSIYVDGVKYNIPDDIASEAESLPERRKRWNENYNKTVAEIKNKLETENQ